MGFPYGAGYSKAHIPQVCSHVQNLFDGVEKKFQYKMRLVYAHLVAGSTVSISGVIIGQYKDDSIPQFAAIASGIGDTDGDGYNDFIITGDATTYTSPSTIYTDHSNSGFSQVVQINNFPVSAVLRGPH